MKLFSRGPALATVVALTALCAALVVRTATPPAVVPASAPAAEFSAERALRHVRVISERPHPTGSADNVRVREYVMAELTALGLEPQLQTTTGVGTRYQVAGRVTNVMARMKGRTPGGPAVMIAAHYDGVGAAPAAGDDAAGSAALLETLRALKSGTPPEHDVIALFTDGEEMGLLGAAAFVREHPWAHDVAMVLNFEARGDFGRSLMFETGTGNLDAVRVLRTVPDVTASSLTVTIYRSLPNDTDLSEFSILAQPALNFAFIGGVTRYHTLHDDLAHLDARSVQHHGSQMLALTRAFAAGPLPRLVTGDAVFFDFPFLGIIAYPERWSLPISLAAAVLVVLVLVQGRRREPRWALQVTVGAVATVLAVVGSAATAHAASTALVRLHTAMGWGGAPMWSGVYAVACALLAFAVTAAAWGIARRWASAAAVHAGALLIWTVLAVGVSWKIPGASFLLAWPLAVVAAAVLARRGAMAAQWMGVMVAASLLVPLIYSVGGFTLPLSGAGAIALGVLVALLAMLLTPMLEQMAGDTRGAFVGTLFGASLAMSVVGMITVRPSVDEATVADLTYAVNADSTGAWLGAAADVTSASSWASQVLGAERRMFSGTKGPSAAPAWLVPSMDGRIKFAARAVPRVELRGPEAKVLTDSLTADGRHLVVRVTTAPGTLAVGLRLLDARVAKASVDGRDIATTRYRRTSAQWTLMYTAPADSGLVLSFDVPRDARPSLEMTARTPGLPTISAMPIAPRPADVVPIQSGDVTVVYRRVRLR